MDERKVKLTVKCTQMNIIMLNVHNVSFGDYKKLHTVLPHLNCEAGLTEYNLVQLVCCLEA